MIPQCYPAHVLSSGTWQFRWLLASIAIPIASFAQEYETQKLVMTGDPVPGLDEKFAYFRAVHLFSDGNVGFAGVTTRTGSFFRNAARGIYLSNTSGTLSVITEINNEDAFRSIGLPDTELDSDDSKTFAFDYINPIEAGNFSVLGRKSIGGDREALNPDDGSFMLVSDANLPAESFYLGNFSTIWGGIMMNSENRVLVNATFSFTDEQLGSPRGLFLASDVNDIRKIVFEDEDAPGFEDAQFTAIRRGALADDGSVFFTSTLVGSSVASDTNETLWVEKNGAFTLLLQEGADAPGLPDKQIRLTGLNLLVADLKGDTVALFAGASELGGTLRRVLWLSNLTGNTIQPIVTYYSSPILSDEDYFTNTDRGAVAFTSIDGNAIMLDQSGNLYFEAFGKFADDSNISGIWRYTKESSSIQLLVESNATRTSIELLTVSDDGDLAFVAKNPTIEEVWIRDASGSLAKVASEGDLVNDRPIVGFATQSSFAASGDASKTLGSPLKLGQLNNKGDLVFVATFTDTENDDDTRADEAIMLAAAKPAQTKRYRWTGDAGDDDWHKVLNWEDLDFQTSATREPGDQPGTEEVVIPNGTVSIGDRSVRLLSLSSIGNLVVNQPLMLEDNSLIENLELNAGLSTLGKLQLEGNSKWKTGTIQGNALNGFVSVLAGAELNLTATDNGGDNDKLLDSPLSVFGSLNHEPTVDLDATGGFALLSIEESGIYIMEGGSITGPDITLLPTVLNRGTFVSSGPVNGDPVMLQADFKNEGGSINVPTGTLKFESFLQIEEGEVTVDSGAALEFGKPEGSDPNNYGIIATGNGTFRGGGTIKTNGVIVKIENGKTLRNQLGNGDAQLELNDGTLLDGEGTLFNEGRLIINDAINRSNLVNEGTLSITGSNESINLEMLDGSLENRSLLLIDQFLTFNSETAGEDEIVFTNRGTLELEGEASISALKENLQFKNDFDGNIVKRDPTETLVRMNFINEGFLNVTQGTLEFTGGGSFGSPLVGAPSSINVEPGATLIFNTDTASENRKFVFNDDYELVGAGKIEFQDDDIRLPSPMSLTNKSADLRFDTDMKLLQLDGPIINQEGSITFATQSAPAFLKIKNHLENRKGAKMVFEPGFNLNIPALFEDLTLNVANKGEMEFKGSNIMLDWEGNAASFLRAFFSNTGMITFTGDGAGTGSKAMIEPIFSMFDRNSEFANKNLSISGHAVFKNYIKACFESLHEDTMTTSISNTFSLKGGTWEVHPGSEVCLLYNSPTQPGLFQEGSLKSIGPNARIILHAAPDEPDGKFAGLPNPIAEFVNKGDLTLKGAALIPQGDFLNEKRIRCEPGTIVIPENSVFSNKGYITGEIGIVGEILNFQGGFIEGGNSPGTVDITGSFTQQAGGTIRLELGGEIPGEDYDLFTVSGTANIGGNLIIACVDDQFPQNGTSFTPFVAGSIVGEFDNVIVQTPSGRQKFNLNLGTTQITAQAETADVSTFSAWREFVFSQEQLLDENISGPNADPDGDNLPNLSEYTLDGNPLVFTEQKFRVTNEPESADGLQHLSIAFPWANNISDFTYEIEVSSNLEEWDVLEHQVIETVVKDLVTEYTLSATIPYTGSNFVRLRFVAL